MSFHSEDVAARWSTLSLAEQLANVGSEVSRMTKWRDRNPEIAGRAFERMLELIDLTLATEKSEPRLKEIARAREILVATWLSDLPADSQEWQSLNRYFLQFAMLARRERG